jgi:hypothetical protein
MTQTVVTINWKLPTVAIGDYFAQGDAAIELLASIPEDRNPEEFLLEQSWHW